MIKGVIKSALFMVSITGMDGNVYLDNGEQFNTIEKDGFMILDREYTEEYQSAIVCDIVGHDSVSFEYDDQWRVCQNSYDKDDYVIVENKKTMNEGDKYLVELEHDEIVDMAKVD
ncbi:hypothetical protein [Siminovitchia fordii]|uniref:Uncharacterized protein n=1 Tax=Siminovitchia fordii TaxID=254759 RepID=A0ABQ4KA89_9BACI|nr:hypothetical protein [Siminovitchia fordii]GIN22634.1 hypothetical protein J1TS3_37680 [Siminovitchia fordii]